MTELTRPAAPPGAPQPIVEMSGISIIFPGVKALDEVSFRMFPGEGVRVTVGERAAEDAVIAAVDALAHNL